MKVEFCLQDEYRRPPAVLPVVPSVGDRLDFASGDEPGARASWLRAVVSARTYHVARETWLLDLDLGENVPEVSDVPDLWRGAGFDVPSGDGA